MAGCLNCAGPLTPRRNSFHIDELLCRDCQRSPAVQMRVLLGRAREHGMSFDVAWEFSWQRIRWPHDTTHRREWKAILSDASSLEVWRASFDRQPVDRLAQLRALSVVAAA